MGSGRYRDSARSFLKGSDGEKKEFASRLTGSADLYQYNNRKPYHSINFITAHDGFSMRDLVVRMALALWPFWPLLWTPRPGALASAGVTRYELFPWTNDQ